LSPGGGERPRGGNKRRSGSKEERWGEGEKVREVVGEVRFRGKNCVI